MKKIMVAVATLLFTLGAYAQVDSIQGRTNTGTMHESDGDLSNTRGNAKMHEDPGMQDTVKMHSTSKSTMHTTPHAKDSAGTTATQHKKTNANMQNPKPVQHDHTNMKTSTTVKQSPPKKAGTEKDTMYLVPDKTMKK